MLSLLRELQQVWEADGEHDPSVAYAATALGETLDGVANEADFYPGVPQIAPWKDPLGVRCSPPSKLQRPSAEDVAAQCPKIANLASLLLKDEAFDALPWHCWSQSVQDLKVALLIGDPELGAIQESSRFHAGVMHIAANAHYPAHCHDAVEIYHLMSGKAQWWKNPGKTCQGKGETAVMYPGDYRQTASQEAHSITTGPFESMLCFWFWSGDVVSGKYWFVEDDEEEAYMDISDIPEGRVGSYYNRMASDYNRVVVDKWGYNLPSAVAATVAGFVRDRGGLHILDIGCGNGLVGAELWKNGLNIESLVGMDISRGMLDEAKSGGNYTSLIEADLSEPLSDEPGYFNLILCVGASTYFRPSVLNHWLKLLAPGSGILCLAHKSEVTQMWEAKQNELVDGGQMHLKYKSEHLPYMPKFAEEAGNNKWANIYIFERSSRTQLSALTKYV